MKQEDDEGGDGKLLTFLQMKESRDKKENGRKENNQMKGRRNHEK